LAVFNATLRAVNTSDEEMAFGVYDCSWYWNWKMQGRGVDWVTSGCTRNARRAVVLKPGEAHERRVLMFVKNGWSADTVTFKIGFSPSPKRGSYRIDETPTYWGEEVAVKVPRKEIR
jgi:hypothetical protein